MCLGCLLPKRHARRSVTRNLLKRQMRGAVERMAAQLPAGLALLRLKQPFAASQFPSASSEALRVAARQELDHLLQRFVAASKHPAAS
jgi:ribonuclease P protein component